MNSPRMNHHACSDDDAAGRKTLQLGRSVGTPLARPGFAIQTSQPGTIVTPPFNLVVSGCLWEDGHLVSKLPGIMYDVGLLS